MLVLLLHLLLSCILATKPVRGICGVSWGMGGGGGGAADTESQRAERERERAAEKQSPSVTRRRSHRTPTEQLHVLPEQDRVFTNEAVGQQQLNQIPQILIFERGRKCFQYCSKNQQINSFSCLQLQRETHTHTHTHQS